MIYARPAILASVKSCITTCSFFSTIRISLVSIRLLRQVNSLSCINCNCNRHEIHYDFSRSIFSRHPPRLSGIEIQRVFRVSTQIDDVPTYKYYTYTLYFIHRPPAILFPAVYFQNVETMKGKFCLFAEKERTSFPLS